MKNIFPDKENPMKNVILNKYLSLVLEDDFFTNSNSNNNFLPPGPENSFHGYEIHIQ